MTLTLSDRDGSFSMPLWNATTLRNQRQAAVDATATQSFDSGQTFLTALEQQGRVTLSGTVTGLRLADDGRYSSDPRRALAEWVAQFESVVNGEQGQGYELTRSYRSDSLLGTVETAEWTQDGGATLEASWDMEVVRGDGTGVYTAPDPDSVAPDSTYSVDGVTLDSVRQFSIEKSQPFETFRRAFAESPDENDVFADAGATRRVSIVGRVVGDGPARSTFDDDITRTLGQDETVIVHDALTGRDITAAIDSYDASDESGLTRLGEYAIELVEGTAG